MISATVPYGSIEEISAVPGVAAVYLEPSYTVPEEQQEQVAEPNMSTAVEMTGTGNVWAAGYTGAGSRIAIIDTGIAPDHQSFNEAAWIYALAKSAEFAGQSLESYMETLDLLDIAELQSVFDRLHVAENHPDLTAEDLYISGKLPFGYNYAVKSLSITHEDGVSEHGSHVAGIAGANRYVPTDEGYANAAEEVYVVGQAPDTQILTMRTFNRSGTCYASDYLAAIEDALILGCDAVNLSLGSGGLGYTIQCDFDGSGNVDEADGQALLDYVTGVRESIAREEYADLSGDGEINTYDVHLFLAELQGQTVVVPASGTVEVSVTIALTDAQKAALDEIYVDWDSVGPGSRFVTPMTIDNTAPQILSVSTENLAEDKLQVTVQDNRYVAAVCLMNASGERFLTAASPNQTELGATTTMEIDLSLFAGNTFMLMVGDYRENETYYRLELEGRPTRVNTDTFRAYRPGSWTSFNVGVNQDEYILAADESNYTAVAYADGMVFGVGSTGLYIYPEEDNFENRRLVSTSGTTAALSMTFDSDTDSLYQVRSRTWTLYKVDLYTGQATMTGRFTRDGASITMRYITYAEDGLYYGVDNNANLYAFRVENDAPVDVSLIGQTGINSASFSGSRGICWDKENDRLYFACDGYLWELDAQTGQGTQVGTLSGDAYRSLYIPDYDPAEDPGPHWYDPVDQVASMTLSTTSVTLLTGESVEVTASLLPWNLSDDSVTWTTSDPAVATVEDGRITGIGAGTATVTAAPVLSPELAQTVSVTVTNANVTVEGVLSDSNDVVQLFTWDLAGSGRWTANAATTLEGITAAVQDNDGQLWVQENAEGYRMYRIDPASGAVLETSPMQSDNLAFNDITASSQYGGVFSVRGTLMYGPWQPGENATSGYIDLSPSMAAYSGSTQLVGIASAGYYAFEYNGEYIDTERMLLLDSASYLWTVYVQRIDTSYRCYVVIPQQISGMESLTYRSVDGQVPNSLVYNAGTQSLTLAHYDGISTQLYLIRPVANGWQGFSVGQTASGETPMALASGSFNADSDTNLARMAPQELAEVLSSAPAAEAAGTVNTVSAAGIETANPEVLATQPVRVDRENRKATVTVEAQQAVTNGLLDIAYDAQILTLDEVRSTVQLTAVNRQAGMLNFGYAAAQPVAQGAGLLHLTFTYAESPTLSETQVTVTTREENQTAPGTTATLTVDFRCSGGEDCPSQAFTDLSANAWYHPYADYVIAKGLMNGMGGGIFAPNRELTRGMMVTTLYRLAGEPEVLEPATFTDVKVGQYYAKAVAWAEDAGITNGVTGNLFAPNRGVTREQAATFLYRFVTEYLGQTPGQGADLIGFRDGNEISGYASTAMAWAVAEGFFQGYPDGSLQPKAALRRIQMAKLLTVLATEF